MGSDGGGNAIIRVLTSLVFTSHIGLVISVVTVVAVAADDM